MFVKVNSVLENINVLIIMGNEYCFVDVVSMIVVGVDYVVIIGVL